MRPMLTGYAGDERGRLVREAAGILGMIEVPEDGEVGARLPARRCTDDKVILPPSERSVKLSSPSFAHSPQTNCLVERIHRALVDECSREAGWTTCRLKVGETQRDLSHFLAYSSPGCSHREWRLKGRTLA